MKNPCIYTYTKQIFKPNIYFQIDGYTKSI